MPGVVDDVPLLLDDGGEAGTAARPRPRRSSSSPSPSRGGGGATPTATTLILLGDMFGLGALSLPSVFARLGWLPATSLLILFSVSTIYSSRLFALLCRLAPRARVFDDYGSLALGNLGRKLTYLSVYLCIFFEPPIFAVTVAESLKVLGLFSNSKTSIAIATTLIMLPLAQVKELEGVAAFSAVGVAGMVVAVAAAVVSLLRVPNNSPPPLFLPPNPKQIFLEYNNGPDNTRLVLRTSSGVPLSSLAAAFFDVVFTFGGQVNWNRYTTGMRDPSLFPSCVAVAVALMSSSYLLVGGLGCKVLGSDFDFSKPLTSLLPPGLDVVVANVGLLAHTLLAFQINVNVWTHLCLHLTCSEPLEGDDDDENDDGDEARAAAEGGREGGGSPHGLRWFLASTLCVLYSVSVAALLPFFSSLMAVIASLGDLAGAYALPALFALVLAQKAGQPLGKAESLLCRVLIPGTLVLSLAGMVLSFKALLDDMDKGGGGGGGVMTMRRWWWR